MKLLEKLTQTPGVPGREGRVRDLILSEINGLFDDVSIDPMGSIIAVRQATQAASSEDEKHLTPKRVMFAAHMDQIGFIVRHIGDDGFLRVQNVGGFDTRNLFARVVRVCPQVNDPEADMFGVLQAKGKPLHLASEEDRRVVPPVQDFYIDVGLSASEARANIPLGSMVVIEAPFRNDHGVITAPALDDRAGCWMLIELMRRLKHEDVELSCEVVAAFTVQEEVGVRGAGPATRRHQPDIGIAFDVCPVADVPGNEQDQQVGQFDGGLCLSIMDGRTISCTRLLSNLEGIAADRGLTVQKTVSPRGGTDASALQLAASGSRAITLSPPVRYIHTTCERLRERDLETGVILSRALLESI